MELYVYCFEHFRNGLTKMLMSGYTVNYACHKIIWFCLIFYYITTLIIFL